MTRTPGWLRRLRQAIPLLRGNVGKHTQQALETFLDMQYARRLRRMNARPVYTPPQTYRVVPDYMQPGSYSSVTEVHHGRAGELHKDVLAACIDRPHLLDDIRTERTRNLHRPGAGATADNHRPVELNLAGQVSVAGPLPGELHLEDTAVDMSLHAAIRADVDGDYTGQITDRYFSQISLSKIFADLGITYTRTAVNA